MKSNLLFLVTLTVFSISCKSGAQKTNSSDFYGEAFELKNVLTYEEMIAKLDNQAEAEVVVKGNVTGVCQAKGCWMNVTSETNPSAGEVFVKFKDYGFFMPKDLSGGKVIMKGKIFKEETSVDELKHYAEDEGKSEEEISKITEPVTELKFLASGVKILK